MQIEITSRTLGIIGMIAGAAVSAANTIFTIRLAGKTSDVADKVQDNVERVDKVLGKFNTTIDQYADKIATENIDITDAMIQDALNQALDSATREAARTATKEVYADLRAQVTEQVEQVVNDIRPRAETEVRQVLQRKVNNINVIALKEEVKREAKAECKKALQTEIDLITSNFTNQVNQQAEFIKNMNAKMQAS